LGVEDGSDEEKEKFLDELQNSIWEEFVDKDAKLLLTEEELQNFEAIRVKGNINVPQLQEEMLEYLGKLIPDLEEIMLEKALQLKEEMVKERIAGMKEYYANNSDVLAKITQAEELIKQNLWQDGADALNAIV